MASKHFNAEGYVWAQLVTKMRKSSLLCGPVEIRNSGSQKIIMQRKFSLYFIFLIAFCFCFFIYYLGESLNDELGFELPPIVIAIISVFTTGVITGFYPNRAGNKISWKSDGSELYFFWGSIFFRHKLSLPKNDLEVVLDQEFNDSGMVLLSLKNLKMQGCESLNIFISQFKSEAKIIFDEISLFLNGKSNDKTVVEIIAQNNIAIEVDSTPIGKTREPLAREMEISVISPDKAVLRPTFSQHLLWLPFLIIGMGVLIEINPNGFHNYSILYYMLVLISCLFVLGGIIGLFWGFGIQKIFIDISNGKIIVKSSIKSLFKQNIYSVGDVLAIQVCYCKITTDDAICDFYEINLIFDRQGNNRLNISTGINKEHVLGVVNTLARFMSKPILDNTCVSL